MKALNNKGSAIPYKIATERRVREKQESRDQDERDLISGAKTRDQLQHENGIIFFPGQVKIDFSKITKLY